jgi:hypothetical protein
MADRFWDPKVWGYIAREGWSTLTTDEALNPATFLAGKQVGGAPKHKCLDIIEY